jgi:tRNA(Ile2)-agmatinylcytidine synthase
MDFPWLVRLNPNIPWKTRGNGALAIHFMIDDAKIPLAKRISLETVEETSELPEPRTDPAVVFLTGPIPSIVHDYSSRALDEVLSVSEAKKVARIAKADAHLIRGTRGIIGALAAIGAHLEKGNYTFEIIAYRSREYRGRPRRVDDESVRKMDSEYSDSTFQNLDPETGRVLIHPHGPDPVLVGIRGHDPSVLIEAFRQVRLLEPVERVMIFRTNQGTDAHLRTVRCISVLKPNQSSVIIGKVETGPRIIRGGHVLFSLNDGSGQIDCVAFEPTGSLRRIVRELLPGDRVRVSGGIRRRRRGKLSLNVEKLEVIQLTDAFFRQNPTCPNCQGRCESLGKNQDFRCKKCGTRLRNASKSSTLLDRKLTTSVFIPPPRARRHLTRPEISNDRRVAVDENHHAVSYTILESIDCRVVRPPSLGSWSGLMGRMDR